MVGPDARRFANGIFTNNVGTLPVGHGHATVRADDRGRVAGLFDLFMMEAERVRVVAEGVASQEVAEVLDRYLFADDVELVVHDDWGGHTFQGAGALEALAERGLICSPGEAKALDGGLMFFKRGRSSAGGVDAVGPRDAVAAWLDGARLPESDPHALECLRILAGEPRWPHECSGVRLPQELGLTDTHLSFNKGCYVGQEIIHRLQMRGQVRRALVTVAVEGRAVTPGDLELDGKVVGELTSVAEQRDGLALGLALVKTRVMGQESWLILRGSETRVRLMESGCS